MRARSDRTFETIYVRDLPQAALAHCDALAVSDRTHPAWLRAAYLASGLPWIIRAAADPRVPIAADDGAVLHEDTVTTAGRVIVTSRDPFYHYGSYFMPVTEKVLDGF